MRTFSTVAPLVVALVFACGPKPAPAPVDNTVPADDGTGGNAYGNDIYGGMYGGDDYGYGGYGGDAYDYQPTVYDPPLATGSSARPTSSRPRS